MKKFLGSVIFLVLALPAAFPVSACDEACQRERALADHNVDFPGYLSWNFCEDTKRSFMEGDIASLESYRNEQLNTRHRGGMNNIKKFVQQRKAWLAECDTYLELTGKGRIFSNEQNTARIFAAMDEVAKELDASIKGVTYVSGSDRGDDDGIVASKFDKLFKLVEDHKARLMRDGQFVTN